ncbi:MAG: 23S rRNA (pseudouridine(1915)-N(3))-methyltransferase RlmH [Clostridia bacterium]|nr:23S rRNA (pseudouridine(1915)-N(3))-methyltransferase RlmH [Clostridia bacterium]
MTVKIIAVGKIQKMYQEIQSEFVKRLSRYCKCEVIEVSDEQAPEKLSDAQRVAVQLAEWEKIKKKLADSDFLVALDSTGKSLSSVELSSQLEAWQNEKNLVFALGGSLGFHPDALKRANYTLSLSKMTFTHSMARVILLEQIYRGFKINANEPYHK